MIRYAKIIVLFFVILFMSLALSGCGGSSSDAADQASQQEAPANNPPVASDVSITDDNSGVIVVGVTLTGSFSYSDIEGDAAGVSTFRWLRNNSAIDGATEETYQLTSDDTNQTIRFEVTPVAQTGTLRGEPVASAGLGVGNTAPVASNVLITGDTAGNAYVGNVLTGNYDYSDIDGDQERATGSDYQWLRDGTAITGATDRTYTVTAADSRTNISFRVTPVPEDNTSNVNGEPVISGEITIQNSAPVASNVSITDSNGGATYVNDSLTATFTFNDPNGDAPGTSLYQWYRDTTAINGATTQNYTVTVKDSGRAISFSVTPVDSDGLAGSAVTSNSITITNSAPVASNVFITGNTGGGNRANVGDTLTGNYSYADADNNPENNSSYQWLRDGAAIGGATQITYTVSEVDNGTTIAFRVTPRDSATNSGQAATSTTLQAAIPAPALSLNVAVKQLQFSWNAVAGATHYKLFENADGASGFTQLGNDITGSGANLDIAVHRQDWLNARYMVQACNAYGCSGASQSNEVTTVNGMLAAIGYVKASNTGASDSFGYAVSLSGDGNTLAVGAYTESSNAMGVDCGGISIDSNTNGIPDCQEDDSLSQSGAVYIYRRDNQGAWGVTPTYIKASNPSANDWFGFSLSLSTDGNTLAIGAYGEDSNALVVNCGGAIADSNANNIPDCQENGSVSNSGAVYVYNRDSMGVWGAIPVYIKSSNTGASDLFGHSVSLSADGNTLVVGATGEDNNLIGVSCTGATTDSNANDIPDCQENNFALYSGAVYVYSRDSQGVWGGAPAYIKASNTGAYDSFGQSISVSADGNIVVIGAYQEDSNALGINCGGATIDSNDNGIPDCQEDDSAPSSGAVYIYKRNNQGGWDTPPVFIKASNTGTDDWFGRSISLSIDGNTLAVGAYQESSNARGVDCNGVITDSNANGILDCQEDNSAIVSGAVYIYDRDELGVWGATPVYIKASNTGAGDWFGRSVSLSTDSYTLAVGAGAEHGNSLGVDCGGITTDGNTNGIPDCQEANFLPSSGAVYLYHRDNQGVWGSTPTYIKASNTGNGDVFSNSISLSADGQTLAVGAPWEDGTATGIISGAAPIGAQDGISASGAVYLY